MIPSFSLFTNEALKYHRLFATLIPSKSIERCVLWLRHHFSYFFRIFIIFYFFPLRILVFCKNGEIPWIISLITSSAVFEWKSAKLNRIRRIRWKQLFYCFSDWNFDLWIHRIKYLMKIWEQRFFLLLLWQSLEQAHELLPWTVRSCFGNFRTKSANIIILLNFH